MIAFTLQNDLNRLYPFLLAKNAVIHSQNKSFGSKPKAHFFSNFFSFETQRCGLIFKKVRLKFETKQIRKKLRLEFGTKWFHANHWGKESPPGVWTSRLWVLNSRWLIFLTQLTSLRSELHYHFFYHYAPRYLPIWKSFDFVSQMGTSPFMRNFSIPRLTPWVFNYGHWTCM